MLFLLVTLLLASCQTVVSTEVDLLAYFRGPMSDPLKLGANITMSTPWTPVPTFGGSFDGAGFYILNLTFKTFATPYYGFFVSLTAGASITNLGLEYNTRITPVTSVLFGGLTVSADTGTTLTNVSVRGFVATSSNFTISLGGVASVMLGSAINVSTDMTLHCLSKETCMIAGVVVESSPCKLQNVSSTGQIMCSSDTCYVAGVANACFGFGKFTGSVSNVTSSNILSSFAARVSVVGGVIGRLSSVNATMLAFTGSYISSYGSSNSPSIVGGVIGTLRSSSVNLSYANTLLLNMTTRVGILGGFVGASNSSGSNITLCFANVTYLVGYGALKVTVGGFLGLSTKTNTSINDSYSQISSLIGITVEKKQFAYRADNFVGGFIGESDFQSNVFVERSYVALSNLFVRFMVKGLVGLFLATSGIDQTEIRSSWATCDVVYVYAPSSVFSGVSGRLWERSIVQDYYGYIGTLLASSLVGFVSSSVDSTATLTNVVIDFADYNHSRVLPGSVSPSDGTYTNVFFNCLELTKKPDGTPSGIVFPKGVTCLATGDMHQKPDAFGALKDQPRWGITAGTLPLLKTLPDLANLKVENSTVNLTVDGGSSFLTSECPSSDVCWDTATVWTVPVSPTKGSPFFKSFPPPPLFSCPKDTNRTCETADSFFSEVFCQCINGCPGMGHGKCISRNTAVCDEGWITPLSDTHDGFCTVRICLADETLCKDTSKCSKDLGICICSDKDKYFDGEKCVVGCSLISNGICVGNDRALCQPGFIPGSSAPNATAPTTLCSTYDCDYDYTECNGEGFCGRKGYCECISLNDYYDPVTRTCVDGCPNINGLGAICIGPLKADCPDGLFPSTASDDTVTLCADANCSMPGITWSCPTGTVCSADFSKCLCSTPTQYFNTKTKVCTEGCPTLNFFNGFCTGANTARCNGGYGPATTTASDKLCDAYDCSKDPTPCNGLGNCAGATSEGAAGTCTCASNSMAFQGSCRKDLCVYGTIANGKCTCKPGWRTDPAASTSLPYECNVYNCGDSSSVHEIVTIEDLETLRLCPTSKFTLRNNLSFTGNSTWAPIEVFSGSLDGNMNIIANITFDLSSPQNLVDLQSMQQLRVGFFKTIAANASVKNLLLEVNVTTEIFTLVPSPSGTDKYTLCLGALACQINSTAISNIGISGKIMLLQNYSSPFSIYNRVNVSAVGGLAGSLAGNLSKVESWCDINCTGAACHIGGLAAYTSQDSFISGSASGSTLICTAPQCNVGGFVSYGQGTFTECMFSGMISVPTKARGYVGGFLGYASNGTMISKSSVWVDVFESRATSVASGLMVGSAIGATSSSAEQPSLLVTIIDCTALAAFVTGNHISGVAGFAFKFNFSRIAVTFYNVHDITGNFCGVVCTSINGTIDMAAVRTIQLTALPTTSRHYAGVVGNGGMTNISSSFAEFGLVHIAHPDTVRFGGLIGRLERSTVTNCYAISLQVILNSTQATDFTTVHLGGFAGFVDFSGTNKDYRYPSIIKNCFSIMTNTTQIISALLRNGYFLGGFVGRQLQASTVTIGANVISESYSYSSMSLVYAPGDTPITDGNCTVAVGGFTGQTAKGASIINCYCIAAFSTNIANFSFLGAFSGKTDLTNITQSMALFTANNTAWKTTVGASPADPFYKGVVSFSGGECATCTSNFLVNTGVYINAADTTAKVVADIAALNDVKTYEGTPLKFGSDAPWSLMTTDRMPTLTAEPYLVADPNATAMAEAVNAFNTLQFAIPKCEGGSCWNFVTTWYSENSELGLRGVIFKQLCLAAQCSMCSLYDFHYCTTCGSGYVAINGSCVLCDKSCNTCGPTPDICTSCPPGVPLVEGKCNSQCAVPNCKACAADSTSICKECIPGYFVSSPVCSLCQPPCKTCSKTATTCTTCDEGYVLNGTSCTPVSTCDVLNCIRCMPGSPMTCDVCTEGYFGAQCNACLPTCKTCFDGATCNSCYNGFILIDSSCVKDDGPSEQGLSGGAIAGIVIFVLLVMAGCGVGVFFLCKRMKKKSMYTKIAGSSSDARHVFDNNPNRSFMGM